MTSREQIREQMKAARAQVTELEQRVASERLVQHFSRVLKGVRWLLYASVKNEISTLPLFKLLRARGEKVYFPRMDGDRLSFHQVDHWEELKAGAYAPEPKQTSPNWLDNAGPSLIIVPGLAFHRSGHRLGFGKGHYDRFLSEFPRFPRLAFAYDFQISQQAWPVEKHDQRMDYVFTPAGIWSSPRIQ